MTSERTNPSDSAGSRNAIVVASEPRTPATAGETRLPPRQLSELPTDELKHLAEDLNLDPTGFRSRQDLIGAVHERRQMIAAMDREAMLDVVRWGRRAVTINAAKEQIALEIGRIKSMNFAGLSQRGLLVLTRLRGVRAAEDEPVPLLVRKLRKNEGFFKRLNRKRRAVLGSLVAGIVGENNPGEYRYLPPPGSDPAPQAGRSNIREEIEQAGLLGGITNRLKKTADQYLNQKLDEIEARIDRKLDEIDRRLGEWRDKEIANRIRILKITLWASVIVGICSLIYAYIVEYLMRR